MPHLANGQRDTSNSFSLNGVDASNLFNGKSTSQVESYRVVNNTARPITQARSRAQQRLRLSGHWQRIPTPAPETIAEVRVNVHV